MTVKIHITGFGKFQDVPENPTTQIIRDLPAFLKDHPLEVINKPPNTYNLDSRLLCRIIYGARNVWGWISVHIM